MKTSDKLSRFFLDRTLQRRNGIFAHVGLEHPAHEFPLGSIVAEYESFFLAESMEVVVGGLHERFLDWRQEGLTNISPFMTLL